MIHTIPPQNQVLSQHQFTRRRVRYLLPIVMLGAVIGCALAIPPQIRVFEVVVLVLLLFLTISTLVSVCELTVVESGLIVRRVLAPVRFTPWDSIERVSVLAHQDSTSGVQIEIATIGFYEGLSPLNRLPGLVYGHGFRETIVVLRDAVENYDALIESLRRHCLVEKSQARR